MVLPLARPALAAGALLVAVETLSDFATVSYFGVDTLSVGIFRVWRGQFDRPAASVLSLLVLLLALGLVGAERLLRRGARYAAPPGGSRRLERVRLTGWHAVAATGTCLAVLALAVGVPVATLLVWSSTTPFQDSGFVAAAVNSVLLAGQVAAAVVVLGLLVVHAARVDARRRVRLAVQATLFGYAVPGPVLAIGALLVLAALRTGLDALGLPGGGALVTGSVAALVVVYTLRFLALGYTTLDARLSAVSPELTSAALSLGASPRRVLTAVHLPLARSGVAVAAVLVAVDALKELPIVLAPAALRLRHPRRPGVAAGGRLAVRGGGAARALHRADRDDPCRAPVPRPRRRPRRRGPPARRPDRSRPRTDRRSRRDTSAPAPRPWRCTA